MTTQEAITWCNEQIGRHHPHMDFFNFYYQHLTGRNPYADGVPLTAVSGTWAANPAGFKRYFSNSDDTEQLPPQGSIMFWSNAIAVVDYASATTITVWEQINGMGVQHTTYDRSERQELGWWVWENFSEAPSLDDEIITDDPAPNGGAQPAKPASTYTWVKHDNLFEVARRLGFRPLELLEHNDITDPRTIKPGDVLHLPAHLDLPDDRSFEIELLPETRPMYMAAEGTRKRSFGNARSANDFHEIGPSYRKGIPIDIVALAHVPLDDTIIDFYLDTIALGSYRENGRVSYTIGFRCEDLADSTEGQ